jgi:hypothetical protein
VEGNEGCAFAILTRSSQISTNGDAKVIAALTQWSSSLEGRRLIEKLRCMVQYGGWRESVDSGIRQKALGFIAGFHVPSNQQLRIEVDCGHGDVHIWILPLPILQEFVASEDYDDHYVVLSEEDENGIKNLTKLDRFFRARNKAYCFELVKLPPELQLPQCKLRVVKMSAVDTEAMSFLALKSME